MSAVVFASIILLGSTASVIVSIVRQKTIFTLSVLFSFVWLMVLSSQAIAVSIQGIDMVPPLSYELLSNTLTIMFMGLLLGQILSYRKSENINGQIEQMRYLPAYVKSSLPYVSILSAVLGITSFVSSGANFSLNFNFLSEVRSVHVQGESGGLGLRLATYAGLLVSTFSIIMAFAHFIEGKFKGRQVFILMLCLLPLSFSVGSRLAMALPLIHYLTAVWFLLQYRRRRQDTVLDKIRIIRSYAMRLLPVILVFILVFTFYGNVRSNQKTALSEGSTVERVIFPIASYIQSSLVSVGPISYWLDRNAILGHGEQYFEVFFKIPTLIGFKNSVRNKDDLRAQFDELGGAVYTPGTAVRHLVSDFGIRGLPYAAFFITFISSILFHSIVPRTFFLLIFCTLITKDIGLSFHKVGLFSMANAWIVVFGLMFYYHFKKYSRRKHSQAERRAEINIKIGKYI